MKLPTRSLRVKPDKPVHNIITTDIIAQKIFIMLVNIYLTYSDNDLSAADNETPLLSKMGGASVRKINK